jgi:hypothetical protein
VGSDTAVRAEIAPSPQRRTGHANLSHGRLQRLDIRLDRDHRRSASWRMAAISMFVGSGAPLPLPGHVQVSTADLVAAFGEGAQVLAEEARTPSAGSWTAWGAITQMLGGLP